MNSNTVNPEIKTAKIVFLGDTSVGKTSVTTRFVRDTFNQGTESTIGAAFSSKTLHTDVGSLKLDIWDTAGQERYRSILPMYYRDACAAIIVMSVIDPEPFPTVERWIADVRKNCDMRDVYIVLAANKADLVNDRKIFKEQLDVFCTDKGIKYFEVSALTGANINEMFVDITNYCLSTNTIVRKNENVIDFNKPQKNKKCC
ncbi:hypothetical protein WA158_004218 [Blastocystis sp. Blastoise]